ncbi:hypothetical protein [Leisingera sp. ANG-M7]|uniref:hypothetical protein n=1 Tax=Leisingera sp. ANG-M7 TaxID=1577902 RepID=UPI00057E0FD2|nr:hypothetical protein [Leisingera sp. ANG-M7]KIC37991.1 hypothetical protein RA26_06935 [Leisingera sp. ANG-M7]
MADEIYEPFTIIKKSPERLTVYFGLENSGGRFSVLCAHFLTEKDLNLQSEALQKVLLNMTFYTLESAFGDLHERQWHSTKSAALKNFLTLPTKQGV